MDKAEIERKIQEEEDYIRSPKLGNSLNKFMSKNANGVEDAIIARLLLIPVERVKEIYEESVKYLRRKMKRAEEYE